MRIKLRSTVSERCISCWYEINIPGNDATITDLIDQLASDLDIDQETCHISLELDGFNLAPASRILGVLRDADLITYDLRDSMLMLVY